MRFHLDESADGRIATGLRRRDRDCTTTTEANLLSSSDSQQLAYAVSEGRVLITRDTDFVEMAIQGAEHPGIVVCKRQTHFGTIIKKLDGIASEMTAEEFQGTVWYL